MSLYVNNAANEPLSVYFNEQDVECVYFNDSLVWEKPPEYTDWQEVLDVISQKANGTISKWPYKLGDKMVFELNSVNDFWGGYIKVSIAKLNEDSIVFAAHSMKSTTYYDASDLINFKGYINSNPRLKCDELYDILPFKNRLVANDITALQIQVDGVSGSSITAQTNISTDTLTDYVFCPTYGELYNATNSKNATYYVYNYDLMGNPSNYLWLRYSMFWGEDYYEGQYTSYGVAFIGDGISNFDTTHKVVALFEIGA